MRKKTKILYIDQGVSYGGAIISLSHLIKHLDLTKFVTVVVSEVEEEILLNHFPSGICIYTVKRLINYSHWHKINNFAVKKKSLRPIRKIFIYLCNCFCLCSKFLYFIRLLKIISKEKPDIIHFNNGMGNIDLVVLSKIFGAKCIVHQRGNILLSRLALKFRWLVDYFVAVSSYTKNTMIAWGISEKKLCVMFDPVLTSKSSVAGTISDFRKSSGDKNFGIFGRIVRWKGQKYFILAAIEVLKKYSNVKAFVVGDSSDMEESYENEVRSIAEGSGVEDRIFFTGYVSNVSDYYGIMDIVVHASIEPEPFGMVVNEAMSFGVPVIASNEGGPIDMIDDGVDGLLIKPGDSDMLAKSIDYLLSDDEKRKQMGIKAKEKAVCKFNVQNYARKMENIYSKLMENIK